jgi:hypothetical protein
MQVELHQDFDRVCPASLQRMMEQALASNNNKIWERVGGAYIRAQRRRNKAGLKITHTNDVFTSKLIASMFLNKDLKTCLNAHLII